jgi:hypothetical protein
MKRREEEKPAGGDAAPTRWPVSLNADCCTWPFSSAVAVFYFPEIQQVKIRRFIHSYFLLGYRRLIQIVRARTTRPRKEGRMEGDGAREPLREERWLFSSAPPSRCGP